jgi:hypothetical protein
METEKRKAGRPRKFGENTKRHNLTLRISEGPRSRLIGAAAASGRSISEEAERRVEQSFQLEDEFGDLARFVGLAVRATEARNGKAWHTDETSRKQTRAAIDAVLDVIVAKSVDVGREIGDVQKLLGENGNTYPTSLDDVEALKAKLETILALAPAQIDALKATRPLTLELVASNDPTHAGIRKYLNEET